MRVVIVSRDAPAQTGVVVEREWSGREKVEREAVEAASKLAKDPGDPEELGRIANELIEAGLEERPKPQERERNVASVALSIAGRLLLESPTSRLFGVGVRLRLDERLRTAYRLGCARAMRAAAAFDGGALAPWRQSLALRDASGGDLIDRVSLTHLGPAFGALATWPTPQTLFGSLGRDDQRSAVLSADSGYSKIHVVRLDRARSMLQRHGGGIIEEGMYLLHPKRDCVLVPFQTYHNDMLLEMTREARVVFGRIGAKTLSIETIEGVTFGGEVVSRVPLKAGSVKADYEFQSNRRVAYEWGSPTFDPERALADCVWIQDNAGVMTIVDQRRTSNLTRYEEFSKVDTSFRMSVDVMKVFAANFAWSETSTYRYEVEFFDKSRS